MEIDSWFWHKNKALFLMWRPLQRRRFFAWSGSGLGKTFPVPSVCQTVDIRVTSTGCFPANGNETQDHVTLCPPSWLRAPEVSSAHVWNDWEWFAHVSGMAGMVSARGTVQGSPVHKHGGWRVGPWFQIRASDISWRFWAHFMHRDSDTFLWREVKRNSFSILQLLELFERKLSVVTVLHQEDRFANATVSRWHQHSCGIMIETRTENLRSQMQTDSRTNTRAMCLCFRFGNGCWMQCPQEIWVLWSVHSTQTSNQSLLFLTRQFLGESILLRVD